MMEVFIERRKTCAKHGLRRCQKIKGEYHNNRFWYKKYITKITES